MQYTKLNLANGQTLTAEHLAHFEAAFVNLCNAINGLKGLPSVTEADAGKFLRVSSAGAWAVEALTDASTEAM